MNIIKLFFGSNLSNPIILFWAIKGITYLFNAKGTTCFETTSFSIMVMQIVMGIFSSILFIIGIIFGILILIRMGVYHSLKFCVARDRLDRMPIFRF